MHQLMIPGLGAFLQARPRPAKANTMKVDNPFILDTAEKYPGVVSTSETQIAISQRILFSWHCQWQSGKQIAKLGISVMFKFEEQSYSRVQIAMKLWPTDGQFSEVQTINWSNSAQLSSVQQATLRKERLRATDCFGEIFANWIWDIQCTQKHLLGKQCKTSFRW